MAKTNAKTAKSDAEIAKAAQALIDLLGDDIAVAIAAKCQPTYSNTDADLATPKLAHAIWEAMGENRYNEASARAGL